MDSFLSFCFLFPLFFIRNSQESAAQSALSEENAASEITKKIGMEMTRVSVNECDDWKLARYFIVLQKAIAFAGSLEQMINHRL